MKMAAAPRVWAVVKKHVPLIKFRKAAPSISHAVEAPAAVPVAQAAAAPQPKLPTSAPRATIIEDWQLSTRYKRRALSAEEIEYINRGGPA